MKKVLLTIGVIAIFFTSTSWPSETKCSTNINTQVQSTNFFKRSCYRFYDFSKQRITGVSKGALRIASGAIILPAGPAVHIAEYSTDYSYLFKNNNGLSHIILDTTVISTFALTDVAISCLVQIACGSVYTILDLGRGTTEMISFVYWQPKHKGLALTDDDTYRGNGALCRLGRAMMGGPIGL